MTEDILGLSLTDVAAAIRDGRISSVEATRACVERIERLQPVLNCFISLDADAALEAAAAADVEMARGRPRGALHGVPLAHKDMFYRAGKVSTFGSKICRDYVPDFTSTLMTRLEAAGALHLGGLNMCEFAVGPTGQNDHFGDCRNPWNPDHISGGSSSGSGAAVAARLVFGAFGSDTGGSVRLPSGVCGVVGMKATYGRVSRYGGMPRCWSLDVFGPLARTVADCAILLETVAGPDPNDATTVDEPVPAFSRIDVDAVCGLRIGVPANFLYPDVDGEVRPVLEAGLDVLRGLGARVVELDIPDPQRLHDLTNVVNKAEAAALHDAWIRSRPQDYSVSVRSRIEAGFHIPATHYLQALSLRPRITADFVGSVFDQADVLFAPVLTMPVPRIEETKIGASADAPQIVDAVTRCTRWVSYLGLPAMSVPCGFSAGGLPVAFQIIGRPFDETTLFALGAAYQAATDWHTRAPPM